MPSSSNAPGHARLYHDGESRHTRSLMDVLHRSGIEVDVVDVRDDPALARRAASMGCATRTLPAVEIAGLWLLAPRRRELARRLRSLHPGMDQVRIATARSRVGSITST